MLDFTKADVSFGLQPVATRKLNGGGLRHLRMIEGAGGGKGGGGFQEDPNTLISTGLAQFIDLLSEGEIVGLVDGGKSIFFDQTPFTDANGELAFNGVTWASVNGLPDQSYMPGFTASAAPLDGFTPVALKAGVENIRRVTDLNADSVVITLQADAMNVTDKSDMKGSKVQFTISVMPQADTGTQPWVNVAQVTMSGKCTSPYQEDHEIILGPIGPGPWDIKVVRNTQDAQNVETQNGTTWYDTQIVYDHKYSYPFSALVGIAINSQYFGSSLPSRSYVIKGLIINVPSNYDPVARKYTGQWDGTFKQAWTNNPAWVFYDLVTNQRYGLRISPAYVDKWALYTVAQYCDAVVSDGNGNMVFQGVPDGNGGMEPRFAFNGVINSQDTAYNVLTAIASSFRGMAYWSAGLVTATQDAPADAQKIFTPANVINGNFEYTGSSKLARHTVAVVAWNNPENFYKLDYEVVSDPQGILKYGVQMLDMAAIGCTSRAQARRAGKWALLTEALETESVKFTTGFDGADCVPGQLIQIADPSYAGVRMGGRILSSTANNVTMDAEFTFEAGHTYELNIMAEDGSLLTLDVANAPGATNIVQLVANFPEGQTPVLGAIFTLTDVGNVEPRVFRVISATEAQPHQWEVFALLHDATKFAEVDGSAAFNSDPTNVFQKLPNGNYTQPPVSLSLQLTSAGHGYGQIPSVQADWAASPDPLLKGYVVSYRVDDDNWTTSPQIAETSFTIPNARPGNHQVRVTAVNKLGIPSAMITAALDTTQFTATDLNLIGNGTAGYSQQAPQAGQPWLFSGRDCTIRWDAIPISAPTDPLGQTYKDRYFSSFWVEVQNADNGTVLRTEYVTSASYTYTFEKNYHDTNGFPTRDLTFTVTMVATDGSSCNPYTITATNPAASVPAVTLNATYSTLALLFSQPTDPDYAGVTVWIGTAPGVATTAANQVWNGLGQPVINIASDTTYYVKWQFLDVFGPGGVSQEYAITSTAIAADTVKSLTVAQVNAAIGPVGGGNRVPLSLFEKGLTGWSGAGNATGLTLTATTLNNLPALNIVGTATAAGMRASIQMDDTGNTGTKMMFPVSAGETLYVSAVVTTGANTEAYLDVIFVDATNTYLGAGTDTFIPSAQPANGGAGLQGTAITISGTEVVPAGAVFAYFRVVGGSLAAGQISLTASKPFVCGVPAGQNVFPTFSPGPNSLPGADVTTSFALPGVNRIQFSMMEKGTIGWALNDNAINATLIAPYWQNIPLAKAPGTATAAGQIVSIRSTAFPVTPGETLAYNVGVETSNMSGGIDFVFWDQNGSWLAQPVVTTFGNNTPFNTRITGTWIVPAGATTCWLLVYGNATAAGTCFLDIAKPMVCGVVPGQTAIPPFSPGPNAMGGADVTASNTAAAISGQGPLATSPLTPAQVTNASVPAGGVNRVCFSQFEKWPGKVAWSNQNHNFPEGWAIVYTNVGGAAGNITVGSGSVYGFPGIATAYNTESNPDAWTWGQTSPYRFPVAVNEWLYISGNIWISASTAGVVGQLWFYDANGNYLGSGCTGPTGGPNSPGYGYVSQVPSTVNGGVPCYAILTFYVPFGSQPTGTWVDFQLSQPMVCGIAAGQTTMPKFNPGPYFTPGGDTWLDPSGRIINAYGLPVNINTAQAVTFNPVYPLSSNSSSTINVASTTINMVGVAITTPPATISGLAAGTIYAVFWDTQSGSYVAVGNSATGYYTNASRYIAFGTQSTQTSGGTYTPPPPPPAGGGQYCVLANSFMPDGRRASDVVAWDEITVLNADGTGYELHPVARNGLVDVPCVRVVTESGASVGVSSRTPITQRDGSTVWAYEASGHEAAVLDDMGFRWERIVSVEDLGVQTVARIECWDKTYAAGEQPGRFVFTHNVSAIP